MIITMCSDFKFKNNSHACIHTHTHTHTHESAHTQAHSLSLKYMCTHVNATPREDKTKSITLTQLCNWCADQYCITYYTVSVHQSQIICMWVKNEMCTVPAYWVGDILYIVSSFCPLTLISVLMPLVLFVISLKQTNNNKQTKSL